MIKKGCIADTLTFVDGLLKPPVVIDCFVIVELVQHERNSNHSWSLHRRD